MKQILSRIAVLAFLISTLSLTAFADSNFDQPETTQNGHYQIKGNWSELKHGWNKLILKILNQEQQPVVGAKVEIAYEMLDMPMDPPNKPVLDKGDGSYEKQVFIGMKGAWEFNISVNDKANVDTLTLQQKVMQ